MGSGAFGVCKLMKNMETGELVAVKQMERGEKVKPLNTHTPDVVQMCKRAVGLTMHAHGM